jgi:serine/threonine protein phosphatase PrpC
MNDSVNDRSDFDPTNRRLVFGSSLASERHPTRNEDALVIDKVNDIYAVFDGLGGYDGGEIASHIGTETVIKDAAYISKNESPADVAVYLESLLVHANENILKVTHEAATTAVVVKIHEFENILYASIAHVGDSRAYVLREGVLSMLTVDHTPFRRPGHTQEAMTQQERLANVVDTAALSINSFHQFKQRNIVGACLGHDNEVAADIKHFVIKPEDLLILTSDGIHDNLTTEEMQELLLDTPSPEYYAAVLTRAAQARARQIHNRAKQDDITAVAIKV